MLVAHSNTCYWYAASTDLPKKNWNYENKNRPIIFYFENENLFPNQSQAVQNGR